MAEVKELVGIRTISTVVVHRREVRCLIEDLCADAGYTRGDSDLGDAGTAVECTGTDGCDGIGENDLCEILTLGECLLADCGYLTSLDILGDSELGAREATDAGDSYARAVDLIRETDIGERGDHDLLGLVTATVAGLVSVSVLVVGGSFLYYPVALVMSECRDALLLDYNLVAGRAVLTLGDTCGSAGSRGGRIGNLCMSLCADGDLRLKDEVTSVAYHTLGNSVYSTGRVTRRKDGDVRVIALDVAREATDLAGRVEIVGIRVLEYRGFTLSDQDLLAECAMLALGESCARTSCRYCLIDDLNVRYHVGSYLGSEYLAALLALCTVGETCIGAGCGVALDRFGFCVSAVCIADKSALVTFFIIFIVVCMCDLGDRLLCDGYGVADRAMLTLGETCARAGGSLCLVYHGGVTECRDVLTLYFTTVAEALGYSILGAGGILRDLPLAE